MLGKKGFIHHPAFIGLMVGLVLGIVLMILVVKGIIPIGLGLCP